VFLGAVRDGPGEEAVEREGRDEEDPLEDEEGPALAASLVSGLLAAGWGCPDERAAGQARAQLQALVFFLFLFLGCGLHILKEKLYN